MFLRYRMAPSQLTRSQTRPCSVGAHALLVGEVTGIYYELVTMHFVLRDLHEIHLLSLPTSFFRDIPQGASLIEKAVVSMSRPIAHVTARNGY